MIRKLLILKSLKIIIGFDMTMSRLRTNKIIFYSHPHEKLNITFKALRRSKLLLMGKERLYSPHLIITIALTRTTIVVRNTGCALSRYTLNFFNELMNESIN